MSATSYSPLAIELAAVSVDGRHTDERSNLLTVQLAEFWKLTQESVSEHFPNTRHAGHDLHFGTPLIHFGYLLLNLTGDGFNLVLQNSE